MVSINPRNGANITEDNADWDLKHKITGAFITYCYITGEKICLHKSLRLLENGPKLANRLT